MEYKVGQTYIFRGWNGNIYNKRVIVTEVEKYTTGRYQRDPVTGTYTTVQVEVTVIHVKLPRGKAVYRVSNPDRHLVKQDLRMDAEVLHEAESVE